LTSANINPMTFQRWQITKIFLIINTFLGMVNSTPSKNYQRCNHNSQFHHEQTNNQIGPPILSNLHLNMIKHIPIT
jgi:hypothetical protein